MRICYLDESGVPELTGGTSHFVLLGLSIQGETWRAKDDQILQIKRRFGLAETEIHSAWIARRYLEQEQVPDFENLQETERRLQVQRVREMRLVKRAALHGLESIKSEKVNFSKTKPYIHLSRAERLELLSQIADAVSGWSDCRIFADCIDKRAFRGIAPRTPPMEEGFTQVVSRFHRYLESLTPAEHGLIVQDNNETVARRLTALMRSFHAGGTRWMPNIPRIVETPLFVDSHLTSLVQVADLCAYVLRRFFENGETPLFLKLLPRFHRAGGKLVGVRHYTATSGCSCVVCRRHRAVSG